MGQGGSRSEDQRNRELMSLRADVARAQDRVGDLSALSLRIASSSDLQSILQDVIDVATRMTGASHGVLAVLDVEGTTERLVTHGLTPEERERIGALPPRVGLLGRLADTDGPLRHSDLAQHTDAAGFPPDDPPAGSFIGGAIRDGNGPLGSIYLSGKTEGEEFTAEDESLLALLAGQAAAAVRHARLHERMEAERSRLDAILRNSPDGIFQTTPAGHYLSANPALAQIYGYGSPEELLAAITDIEHQLYVDPDRRVELIQRLERDGVVQGFEAQVYRRDGSVRWTSRSARAVCDEAGVVRHYEGTVSDITDRKRAEEEREEERQRLRTLVDTSPVGVFVAAAPDGRVLLLNREARRILHLIEPPNDRIEWFETQVVYRRPDGQTYEPEDLPLQRALHRGETVRAEEIRLDLPDGATVPALVNATPLHGADGEITGAVAVIQDISPLEELEKLRSEFLGMVSHDLKTPLTSIKGAAATALGSRRPLDTVETRGLFAIVDEQADRLRDLVDNLLDMTRIEAGSLAIAAEPASLQALLQKAATEFSRASGSQDLRVTVADDLPRVMVDPQRVLQVVTNLLSNAAKFSPAESPIVVEAEDRGGQIVVCVRDRGRGIPAEMLPHLFRKFSQVHRDSGPHLAGSGLGLAISKGIVEAHGGRIWAESPGEGQGSSFSFTLPAAVAAADAPASPAQRSDHLGRVSRAGERTRILAVDDDVQTLRLLRRSLEDAGYHVTVTSDPVEAPKLAEAQDPDLILMDYLLPEVSGLDLLQRIREFSGVPVVFLAAQPSSEDAARALRMGADDYVTKPFSPSELLARIEATLRRRLLPDTTEVRPVFLLGDLSVDFADRRVSVGGTAVPLSATEYKVLYELTTNAGRVLTHDQILHRVWGPQYSGEAELVRSFIRNLRRKLGDDARHPRFIFTEPQVGYRVPRP